VVLVDVENEFCERQTEAIEDAVRLGELQIGWGLNQRIRIWKAGDAHWDLIIKNLQIRIFMFAPIINALDFISLKSFT